MAPLSNSEPGDTLTQFEPSHEYMFIFEVFSDEEYVRESKQSFKKYLLFFIYKKLLLLNM